MNIVVIGLGSMGKRRIRLLREIDANFNIVGIDSNSDRRKEVEELFEISTFSSIEMVDETLECAIVATSPLSHAPIINQCLKFGLHVFSEINLTSSGYKENIQLAQEMNKVLFLSSTFLYRKEIQYIADYVSKANEKLIYIYHVGQYLPDWHPWEDYRDFFIGKKESNGCRELLAIELPWIDYVFGNIIGVQSDAERISTLDIDFNDNYLLHVNHETGNKGVVVVDVLSRVATRSLEIIGENTYLTWDGTPGGLKVFNKSQLSPIYLYDSIGHQDGYASFIIENAYKEELLSFFKQIKRGTVPVYDFNKDLLTLSLIDNIEKTTR